MEFELNFDPNVICNMLRKSFHYYPIEMQLVWLSELLLITAFTRIENPNKIKLNKAKDKYVFTQRDSRFIINNILNDNYTYTLLDKFRNEYVHKGSDCAYDLFKELFSSRNPVDKLAKFAGVTLNWNCSLYEILDIKDF